MTLGPKHYFAALLALLFLAPPATAATVSASGSAQVFFQGTTAYDLDGNYYDWQEFVSFTGDNAVSASSGVTAPNAVSSTPTISKTYTVTNTSQSVIIDWLADIQLFTFASAQQAPDQLGEYYYDSNTYVTAGGFSAFASVNGTYVCSVLNAANPAYDCFGYMANFSDPQFNSAFGTLNPGETISFELTAQSFATQRFVAVVPLPATAMLLGLGLLGLAVGRHGRSKQPKITASVRSGHATAV